MRITLALACVLLAHPFCLSRADEEEAPPPPSETAAPVAPVAPPPAGAAVAAPETAAGGTQTGALKSPRHRIAVAVFENKVAFSEGGWDLGTGMTEMLTTALMERKDSVQTLERSALGELLNEKEINKESGGTEMAKKNLVGAQYIIKGAVTEFQNDMSGGDGGMSVGPVRLGRKKSLSKIAIDIRIVDAGTGEVLSSKNVSGMVQKKGLSGGFSYGSVAFGGEKFHQTPIGEACRACIAQGVEFILADVGPRPWRSVVVLAKEPQFMIRGGAPDGIAPGMRFQVTKRGGEVTDPETGEILASETKKGAVVEVTEAKEKVSLVKVLDGPAPERNDLVEYLKD